MLTDPPWSARIQSGTLFMFKMPVEARGFTSRSVLMSDVFSTFCDRLAKAALVGTSTVNVALGSCSDGVRPAEQHSSKFRASVVSGVTKRSGRAMLMCHDKYSRAEPSRHRSQHSVSGWCAMQLALYAVTAHTPVRLASRRKLVALRLLFSRS